MEISKWHEERLKEWRIIDLRVMEDWQVQKRKCVISANARRHSDSKTSRVIRKLSALSVRTLFM
jgi:hypothetical protein